MIDALPWFYVEVADVIALHRSEIERSNAPYVAPTPGCVERSIGAAASAALYTAEDDAVDLISTVAYLICRLTKNHCFQDGNKRAAWMSALHCLQLNGLTIRADQVEAAAVVNKVATNVWDVIDVRAWLCYPGRVLAVD